MTRSKRGNIMGFPIRNERGFVLITCLTILLMLGIIGATAVMKSADDVAISGSQLRDVNALYAAESGAELAYACFRNAIDSTNYPPNPLPSGMFDLEHYHVSFSMAQFDTTKQTSMTQGMYRGLYGLGNQYDVVSTAVSSSTPITNTISLRMEKVLVPLFQFAVFYEPDMEIHPGPFMTLNGRVHANGNLWLGSNKGLDIESFLTAAGTIKHGHKPGSGQSTGNGSVRAKDANGTYQDMKNVDGTWLDNTDDEWVDESLERWTGQVQDKDHGISELYLPVAVSGDPIDLIHDGGGGTNPDSYENKAGLKIINGTAYFRQADNSWTNVTAAMIAEGSISNGTFYDGREQKDISSLDIDISKLNTSAYWPTNGLVYTKQTAGGVTQPATRLIDGSTLKAGLTVVSENPLYTQGDYNSSQKKPAAVICDAYNILSNSWDDANSTLGIDSRVADNTTINVSFITGNTTTGEDGNNYNGGLENLPRFLEKWTGKTLKIRGSMVDLWESEQATGKWGYGSYYTAPNRDWGFDTDLLDPD
jgi:hypothetical protein